MESLQGLPPLGQALLSYDDHQRRRFHVPAHAGQLWANGQNPILDQPYRYDLTELDGLDVLSEPSGCLLEAQRQVANLFGAAHSFFLVNGASAGLLAAMLTALRPGDKVLLPRNVHRSVVSGLVLSGAEPVWFLPERLPEWGLWGAVSIDRVRRLLDMHPDLRALVVTSPTYEGLGSDILALLQLCREHDVYLIVDEAHGSLWPFSDRLPVSAVQAGADVVIHSIHKSGGCLTQGALAHLPPGSLIDPEAFQQALNMVQTTSPSYLLMADLERTCHFLASEVGKARLHVLFGHIDAIRQGWANDLKSLRLFEPNDPKQRAHWDPAKLYWVHPQCRGEDWGAFFEEELQLAYESASPYGVLYLANLGLEPSDFDAFSQMFRLGEDRISVETFEGDDSQPGLSPAGDSGMDFAAANATESEIATEITATENAPTTLQARLERQNPAVLLPEMAISPRDAFFALGERVNSQAAIGRIAKETVVHCPPGIPVLLPGEIIQPLHVPFLPETVWVIR